MNTESKKKRKWPAALIVIALLVLGVYIYQSHAEVISDFKPYYIKAYFKAFLAGRTASPEQTGTASSIPVLLYHGIPDSKDPDNVSLRNFADQLIALKQAGYQTIRADDLTLFLGGKKELPERSFLLTFDDGAKDSYYPVDPFLKALDYTAVSFIITHFSLDLDRHHYYLPKATIQKMIKSSRWEIQSHGRNDHVMYTISSSSDQGHFLSNRLYLKDEERLETDNEFRSRIETDLLDSKADLEKTFGISVNSFAYPFGDFGQNTVNFPAASPIISESVKSVYNHSFYQVWEGYDYTQNYPEKDTFLLKRISVEPTWTGQDLLRTLENGKAKSLPYRDDLAADQGWISMWGNKSLSSGRLELTTTETNNGSSVFLDGSYPWQDYAMNTKLEWTRGKTVSLLTRLRDPMNYAACNFEDRNVRIDERQNNKSKELTNISLTFTIPKTENELKVVVKGNVIECLIGSSTVAKAKLSDQLSKGGVGLKIWDPAPKNSLVTLKLLEVETLK